MTRDPQAIARAVVRLHYDPEFARQLERGGPLPGVSAQTRAMLRQVDPRAFRTDPLRPVRTLHALIDEFPASCAVVKVPRLRQFFADPLFHDAVMRRGSLALAFGDYLTCIRSAREFARLEILLARLRRMPPNKLVANEVACARGVTSIALKDGTLAAYESIRARIGPEPTNYIVEHAPLPAPTLGHGCEYVYVLDGALGRGSSALHHLLDTLSRPLTWTRACDAAVCGRLRPRRGIRAPR